MQHKVCCRMRADSCRFGIGQRGSQNTVLHTYAVDKTSCEAPYQEALAKVIRPDNVYRYKVVMLEGQLSQLVNALWWCSLAQNLVYLQVLPFFKRQSNDT